MCQALGTWEVSVNLVISDLPAPETIQPWGLTSLWNALSKCPPPRRGKWAVIRASMTAAINVPDRGEYEKALHTSEGSSLTASRG